MTTPRRSAKPRRYVCRHCGRAFRTRLRLGRHQLRVRGDSLRD